MFNKFLFHKNEGTDENTEKNFSLSTVPVSKIQRMKNITQHFMETAA